MNEILTLRTHNFKAPLSLEERRKNIARGYKYNNVDPVKAWRKEKPFIDIDKDRKRKGKKGFYLDIKDNDILFKNYAHFLVITRKCNTEP